jgi:hypothetical protein
MGIRTIPRSASHKNGRRIPSPSSATPTTCPLLLIAVAALICPPKVPSERNSPFSYKNAFPPECPTTCPLLLIRTGVVIPGPGNGTIIYFGIARTRFVTVNVTIAGNNLNSPPGSRIVRPNVYVPGARFVNGKSTTPVAGTLVNNKRSPIAPGLFVFGGPSYNRNVPSLFVIRTLNAGEENSANLASFVGLNISIEVAELPSAATQQAASATPKTSRTNISLICDPS